jgi:hypothetical protein
MLKSDVLGKALGWATILLDHVLGMGKQLRVMAAPKGL